MFSIFFSHFSILGGEYLKNILKGLLFLGGPFSSPSEDKEQ